MAAEKAVLEVVVAVGMTAVGIGVGRIAAPVEDKRVLAVGR